MLIIDRLDDRHARDIFDLHRAVAAQPGSGLARTADEINLLWVEGLLRKVREGGLIIGAFDGDQLVGEIHASRIGPTQFSHVLTDLTIATSPDHQGKGVGNALFAALFEAAAHLNPPATRIELVARSGNQRAIALYERLGFVTEGCFKGRVILPEGTVEDDIPMAKILPSRQA